MSDTNIKMDLEEFYNELLVGAEKEQQERKMKQEEYHARELAKAEVEREKQQDLLNKLGESVKVDKDAKARAKAQKELHKAEIEIRKKNNLLTDDQIALEQGYINTLANINE